MKNIALAMGRLSKKVVAMNPFPFVSKNLWMFSKNLKG
jgi:hypothetical protein